MASKPTLFDRISFDFDALADAAQTTVKFRVSDDVTLTQARMGKDTIEDVKQHLSKVYKIESDKIHIKQNGNEISDCTYMRELPINEFSIIELNLDVDDENFIEQLKLRQAYTIPDILTVKVTDNEGKTKEIVVEVENRAIEKPNLGGYRNILTGQKFDNDYTQTGPPPPKVPPELKNHRDTQTYSTRNRKMDTGYSRAIQMSRDDLYIPSLSDRILTPGPYETADEKESGMNVIGKVKTIQRYYRVWKMKKMLKELHNEYQKRKRLEEEREERERCEDEARKKRDLISKVFPLTQTDFAMLYSMVERWKRAEIKRITSVHCGASKIAEFYLLLEKEIEILRNLEQLRNKVKKDMEIKRVLDFFKAIGQPLEWYGYKNIKIQMDTLETQKGREYFAMYKSLTDKSNDVEKQIKVYLEVKEYLKKHSCQMADEIIQLIDRVTHLMVLGYGVKDLVNLNKRIEGMVLQHMKMVECNEGVTNHMKKMQKKIMKDLILCKRCLRPKPIEAFRIDIKNESKVCSRCRLIDKVEEPWIDVLPYRYILKQIRYYERLHHAVSSICFILTDKDIYHIITNIWHGHSALSECNEIYKLRLVRWRIKEEWSPWNCILLTVEEAKAHLRVENLKEIYEVEFMNHVFNKHALAKQHFTKLKGYDKKFWEVTKNDPKLNEHSEFYTRGIPDCVVELDEDVDDDINKNNTVKQ